MPKGLIVGIMALALVIAGLAAPSAQARDAIVTSFDGTPIVTHYFPGDGVDASNPAPTILVGPGWSMSGDTQTEGANGVAGAFGVTAISVLIDEGYNVLTWDPRGFGGSGGTVMVDDPDFEGRDVQALIDFIAEQPESLMDDPASKDPRIGMAGASYGGGIQMVVAGMDDRVDAIAPTIAWHNLISSLFPTDSLKLGWASLLVGLGVEGAVLPGLASPVGPQTGNQAPEFYSVAANGIATGHATEADKQFFADNGPDTLLKNIDVPTLLIQGTTDTLFPLDEAIRNYRALNNNTRGTGKKNARKGLPVKMIFFCGGHGVCFTGDAPEGYVDSRVISWFDRYLRKDTSVNTGPRFSWVADDGVLRNSQRFPGKRAGNLQGTGSGVLTLVPGNTGSGGLIFATPAPIAVNVDIPGPPTEANALGGPRVELTYSGVAAPAETFAYGQIVNPRNNQVVGNVTTPIPLTLDGTERTQRIGLEWIASRAPAGGNYTFQLAPASTVYDIQRSGGTVDFSEIKVRIPLREPVKRRAKR